jgi:homoprotocatechuate degradation regulator HpaR
VKPATLPRRTDRSLPMALLRARESVMRRFRPLLASHHVTEQQWRILRVLAESGPVGATQLAARCCILRPSMTLIVRTLARRKLVSRKRDPHDGRRLVLEATPAAIALIQRVAPGSNAIYRELEAEFGRERLEHLLDVLEALSGTRR